MNEKREHLEVQVRDTVKKNHCVLCRKPLKKHSDLDLTRCNNKINKIVTEAEGKVF